MPAGSVVVDKDGRVVATAVADNTTEFRISAGDVKLSNKLSVRTDKSKPETEFAFVYPTSRDRHCVPSL